MTHVHRTHPPAASAVPEAAWTRGATAEAKDALKRNQYRRTGTGACSFLPFSHETYGRTGPDAFALLNEIADYAAGIGSVSRNSKLFMERVAGPIYNPVPGGCQESIASMPMQAWMDGKAVLPGLTLPNMVPCKCVPGGVRDCEPGTPRDLLAFLPGRPVVMDVCVTQPHAQLCLLRQRPTNGRQGRPTMVSQKIHPNGPKTAALAPVPDGGTPESRDVSGRAEPEDFKLIKSHGDYVGECFFVFPLCGFTL